LLEWRLKLNTGNNSNTTVEMWVDDASVPITTQTKRASYTDLPPLSSSPTTDYINHLFISEYMNVGTCVGQSLSPPDQYMKWDQLVISRAPIGPMGAPPAVTGKPPQAPTNLSIR